MYIMIHNVSIVYSYNLKNTKHINIKPVGSLKQFCQL